MFYKNVSSSEKTFHGVTFKAGETKEVDKYINNKFMILVDGKNTKPKTTNDQQKLSSEKPKEDEPKKEDPKPEEPKDDSKDANKNQKDQKGQKKA